MTRELSIITTRETITLKLEQPEGYRDSQWSAIDPNKYDVDFIGGEYDEWKELDAHGWGDTIEEAIEDFIEQRESK